MFLEKAVCLFLAFWGSSSKQDIQVVPVASTPQNSSTQLEIVLPEEGEVLEENPVYVQFRLRGFALGSNPDFERASELVNSRKGQTIHFIVDNKEYFTYAGPSVAPFDGEGNFYQSNLRVKLPFSLKRGMHTIRAFPARSFGESLKEEDCFSAVTFYIKERSSSSPLDGPYLTYNEPSNDLPLVSSKPVLLDFYLTNCELSEDGYKVKLTIDNKTKRTLTDWTPYYIYGLGKGSHTIRLELLNKNNRKVPGPYNDVTKKIRVR